MYKKVFIALLITAPVFALTAEKVSAAKVTRNQEHDIRVGYCAAYYMFLGQGTSARQIQNSAVDKLKMAEGGTALAEYYQISDSTKKSALIMGRDACAILKSNVK